MTKFIFNVFIYTILLVDFIPAQNLRLSILIEKNEFIYGEPVYAFATIENKSNTELEISPFTAQARVSSLQIEVYENNLKLTPNWDYKFVDVDYLKYSLNSEEILYDMLEISGWYGNTKNELVGNSGFGINYYAFRPGKYKIRIEYLSQENNLLYDETNFEVRSPKTEAELFHNDLFKMSASSFNNELYEDYKNGLLSILNDSSNSIYKALALYHLRIFSMSKENNGNYLTYLKRLIIEYPDSFLTISTIGTQWLLNRESLSTEEILNSLRKSKYYHIYKYFLSGHLL